jgi:hypothetical protein
MWVTRGSDSARAQDRSSQEKTAMATTDRSRDKVLSSRQGVKGQLLTKYNKNPPACGQGISGFDL